MMAEGKDLAIAIVVLMCIATTRGQAFCEDATSCCACVSTPGCSWFYNETISWPYCAQTPFRVNPSDPTLQARTPFTVVKRIIQPRGRCKPINAARGRLITPQALQVKQNVGVRQEVPFEVQGPSRRLRLRILDDSNGAVGISIIPAFSNTCPRGFSVQRTTTRRGPRMEVTCMRGAPRERSKFKLRLDVLKCFSEYKHLRVIVMGTGNSKRLRVGVEANCACPCQSRSQTTPATAHTATTVSPDGSDERNSDASSDEEAGSSETEPSVASPTCQVDCSAAMEGVTSPATTCQNDACHATANDPICSDRGSCICGMCACGSAIPANPSRFPFYSPPAPDLLPYGQFCECESNNCLRNERNLMCGGPSRGVCDCNACRCRPGYSGEACEYADFESNCRPPGDHSSVACSGRGVCVQNQFCQCDAPYAGEFCQECPTCSSPCQLYRRCVECFLFEGNDHSRCVRCQEEPGVRYHVTQLVRDTENLCVFRTPDDCQFQFTYGRRRSGETIIYIRRHITCPEPSGRLRPQGRGRRRP